MAGGQLVPHALPDGRTIMVPEYLARSTLTPAPRVPMPGSDRRVAGPGGGEDDAPEDFIADQQQQEAAAKFRAQLAQPAPPTNAHAAPADRVGQLEKLGGKPEQTKDPAKLVKAGAGGASAAQQQGAGSDGGMNPLVRRVLNDGGRGGGPARPGGLYKSGSKVEIQPGKELLPELKWQLGVEERPQEIDPNAEQPTWGDEDPVMRGIETPVTQGMARSGARAARAEDARIQQQLEQGIAARQQLLGESQMLDEQLNTVAQRRDRIAKLQETAEQRMREAESFEPRTKEQVWESKGAFAQVMGVLAAALGGYTQGLGRSGGKNLPWEMINQILDDDVAGDRYKAEQRAKRGQAARNDYERALQLYGDPEIAAFETKQRKLANTLAMTQNLLANRNLDATRVDQVLAVQQQAEQAYLMGQQQLFEMLNGHVIKETADFKQEPAGGGGGGYDTLQRLERAARAEKALATIEGRDHKPKIGPAAQAAMNEEEANLIPMKQLLQKYKGYNKIPGVQPHNVASRAVRAGLDWVGGEGAGTGALDSDEERANRIIVERAALAYRHAVTGAGGSNTELAGIDRAFAGARTYHDLQEAVRLAETTLAEKRRLAAGGQSAAGTGPARVESEQALPQDE